MKAWPLRLTSRTGMALAVASFVFARPSILKTRFVIFVLVGLFGTGCSRVAQNRAPSWRIR